MNEGINWGTDKKGHHFPNDIIFEFIFLNENGYLLIQISQKSVLKDPNDEHCFRYWLCAELVPEPVGSVPLGHNELTDNTQINVFWYKYASGCKLLLF